ncbi:MAG: serine/threonine-protein phosphatase [Lachnospiraceae bacterium]|nr:serine/threonine-protein phosphatase [Lachnospiraceae bacterium]
MTQKSYIKYHSIIAFTIMVLMFSLGLFSMIRSGIHGMEKYSLFNSAYEIMPMIASILLFFCCMLDGMQKAKERKLFMALVFTNFFTIVLDFTSYSISGKANLQWISALLILGVFGFTALMEWLLLEYFTGIMEIGDEKPVRVIRKVTIVWLFFSLGCLLINYFKPFIYYVNENGQYVETKWFNISLVFQIYVALSLVILAVVYRERLKKNQILAVVLFGLSHLFLIALYSLHTKIFITSGIWVLVFLGLYMLINVKNGNKRALTKKELETAKNIQKSMLPVITADIKNKPEFDVYAVMEPARDVGSDFYNFFLLDDDHFAFLVGDVASRGVGAALYMAVTSAMINMHTKPGVTPAAILDNVNQGLREINNMDMNVGIWLGIFDLHSGHLVFCNAGHSDPVILRKQEGGDFKYKKRSKGPLIGAVEETAYKNEEIILEPGDRIFLYTDGVIECSRKKTGECFGMDRMIEILNANKEASNRDLCSKVIESIFSFLDKEGSTEDITLLGFTYEGERL